jgi:membrane-associated protease RseP (regulator of RpoE activity)
MDEEKIPLPVEGWRRPPFSLKRRIWLNVLLFVVTVFSTIFVGTSMSLGYEHADAVVGNSELPVNLETLSNPQVLSLSVVYAAVLLGILLGHELGHFLTCRYYRIDATLPYFIPAPTLIGTLGAFIKIKSPITRKQQLFDIGVAGPLTGFILSLPAVIYGLSLSKVVRSIPPEESLTSPFVVHSFGEPLILKIVGALIFKNIPPDHEIFLHPVAFAGWVGILVTAFNLFPIGQLDGGHVAYALFGRKSQNLARFFLLVFVFMGIFFWIGWFIWAFIIVILGLRHPRIQDEATPLSPRRKLIGFVIILIFILSFIPDPIKGYNLFDIIRIFQI